jgi:hypothetical protein|tara:strand:- start:748 stop:1005 length:258 start_codon:yes stop_codon:yes gene_type:complete
MYYATTTDQDGEVFTIKKTLGELGNHFQRNLEAFGGNPDAEYIVYRGKPGNRTFQGYYTLNNGRLKKKPPVNSVEALLGVYNFLG